MSWARGTFRRFGMRCVVLPPNTDLHSQARRFAQLLNDLLNGTITNGVRMRAVVVSTGQVSVGYALTKSMVVNRQPFPLAVDSRSPACFMGLSYTMTLDTEGQYLTTATSVCALYADAEGNDELFHYDYERNKRDGYPEAHLQVHAESTSLGAVMAKRGLNHHMHKLHFPVGAVVIDYAWRTSSSFSSLSAWWMRATDGNPYWGGSERRFGDFSSGQPSGAIPRPPCLH